MGIITSEMGVQQGDPLGPLLFCLVLQKIISTIGVDPTCNGLKFHSWYIDDVVVAGPSQAVKQVISILHLFLNTSKCELFSKSDLSTLPQDMQRSIVPNIEILLMMTTSVPILWLRSRKKLVSCLLILSKLERLTHKSACFSYDIVAASANWSI